MRDYLNRAYRERRRVILASALAYLAGHIFYMRYSGELHGLPIPVFAGLFYAVFIGIAALVMCVFLPKLRFTVEAIAFSRLGFAIFVWQVPELGQKLLDSPLVNATIVVGGAWVITKIAYSPVAARVFARINHVETQTIRSMQPVGQAGSLVDRSALTETLRSLQSALPGKVKGTSTLGGLDIQQENGETRVIYRLFHQRQPLFTAAIEWLDDTAGRLEDQLFAPVQSNAPTAKVVAA